MKAKFLVCVSYAALFAISTAVAQQSASSQNELLKRELESATSAGIAASDLTGDTIKVLQDKIASEAAANAALAQQSSAQSGLQQADANLQSAKAEADSAYKALIAAGLSPISAANGTITTADQAKLQANLTAATSALTSANNALQQARLDAEILAKNPGAFTAQQREQIPLTLKNALEHVQDAQNAANRAGDAAKTGALALLQAYNGAQTKVNAATAAQSQAQQALQTAQQQVRTATANDGANQIILSNRPHMDTMARAEKDANAAAAAARANAAPPVSVLAGASGVLLLNVFNLQKSIIDGTIKVSDLTPSQISAIVSQGGGNIIAQGGGNIRIADLTPAMLSGIIAQGGGNIVSQGGGNLAQIAAAVGIVSQGGGNIVSTGGGNLGSIASWAVSNVKIAESALLTAGLAASLVTDNGAGLINTAATSGLINTNAISLIGQDGGSLIGRGGTSLIGQDGASLIGQDGASLISQDGGSLIGRGGASLIGQDGASLIGNDGGSAIVRNFQGTTEPETPSTPSAAKLNTAVISPVPTPVPVKPAGGGFRPDSTISVSGSYVDQNTGKIVSTNPMPSGTTTLASAPTTTSTTITTHAPSASGRPYDANDWTTWPQTDISTFLPPGKTVEQFKAGTEKDLDDYRRTLAALPQTGLTAAQQSQKAGLEAQIRSLEFQLDTANRTLGLPSVATVATTTTAPVATPTLSAATIANTVQLQTDLAAAQAAVNGRSQQIAETKLILADYEARRAAATDPEVRKGLDAAIASGKFQIEVMELALKKEAEQVDTLTAAKAAAAPPTATVSAATIANSVQLQNDLAAAQAAVNGRAVQIADFKQQLADLQAKRAAATDPEIRKGLDAAITGLNFQLDVLQLALAKETQQLDTLTAAKAVVAATANTNQPMKISKGGREAIDRSLRTIPGKLSAPEKKRFDALSGLAEKAATRGLSADEAATLRSGINALAARHPRAAARYNLVSLVNAVSSGPAEAAAKTPAQIQTPTNIATSPTLRAAGTPPQTKTASAPIQGPASTVQPAGQHTKPSVASRTPGTPPAPAAKPMTSPRPVATAAPPKPVVAPPKPAAQAPRPMAPAAPPMQPQQPRRP